MPQYQVRCCEEKEKYEPRDRFPTEPYEWVQKRFEEYLE